MDSANLNSGPHRRFAKSKGEDGIEGHEMGFKALQKVRKDKLFP